MIQRRTLLTALAAGAAGTTAARAQGWKSTYKELVYAHVPSENATSMIDHWQPFVGYLSKELGVKVTLRIANDYAAVIEGQRAGNIHIANYGPAAFARARMTGVAVDAFVIDIYRGGLKGYYSVFYVRADSPYKTIADLKGKNIGIVDPNSMSGYSMPMYALNKSGIPIADKFFGKVLTTGSHENAIIALAQGTVDCAVNWWDAADDSNLINMVKKGMVKDATGKTLKTEDFRIVLTSDLIINAPTAYLSGLPADLKTAIKQAFLDAPKKDPVAFAKISDGKDLPWQPIETAAYDDTIKLIKFVDGLRKKA